MSSLLQSTRNTRALPTGTMRYIRSDAPENLTDKEVQWLLDNNIITIVDLRSEEEIVKKPCFLKGKAGFRYIHFPVTGGGDTPKSLEHLHIVYQRMVDEKMEKIIDIIMNAESNVMYFCTAGKDRTGVVSAIILKRLGFSDEVIIEDYMKSKDNLMDMLQIDKIYGIVLEENIASYKVLEKNGFKLVFKGIDKYQSKNRELRKYIFER